MQLSIILIITRKFMPMMAGSIFTTSKIFWGEPCYDYYYMQSVGGGLIIEANIPVQELGGGSFSGGYSIFIGKMEKYVGTYSRMSKNLNVTCMTLCLCVQCKCEC